MTPKYIIIHTAAHGTPSNNADTTRKQIDDWHRGRGWQEIGYHFVVRLDGTVERGRAEDMQGAHCTSMGMNSKSLGVCFSGHGDFHPWTAEQREAGKMLVRALLERHGIRAERVLGHHETGARKTCPGKLIDMDEVRHALTGAAVPAPAAVVDATGMFRHLCAIFDDPEFTALPQATQQKVKELRTVEPFAELTREDLV